MTTEQNYSKAIEILQNINVNAQMALAGDWDRSNDGFESQIQIIEEFFNSIDVKPKEYVSEKVWQSIKILVI